MEGDVARKENGDLKILEEELLGIVAAAAPNYSIFWGMPGVGQITRVRK